MVFDQATTQLWTSKTSHIKELIYQQTTPQWDLKQEKPKEI